MRISLNGELASLAGPTSVAQLLAALLSAPEQQGIAVAVNGEVVRRGEHATTTLRDGDVVEIVTAVQGG